MNQPILFGFYFILYVKNLITKIKKLTRTKIEAKIMILWSLLPVDMLKIQSLKWI